MDKRMAVSMKEDFEKSEVYLLSVVFNDQWYWSLLTA